MGEGHQNRGDQAGVSSPTRSPFRFRFFSVSDEAPGCGRNICVLPVHDGDRAHPVEIPDTEERQAELPARHLHDAPGRYPDQVRRCDRAMPESNRIGDKCEQRWWQTLLRECPLQRQPRSRGARRRACPPLPRQVAQHHVRRDDGSEKDTLINLRASGELVINAVTEAIVHAANACAETLPPQQSEFEFASLTPVFLTSHAPHVAQSPLRFECKVERAIKVGDSGPGVASLVIVSVTQAYVTKGIYRGKGQLDVEALRLIGRSSIDQYLIADGQFMIARPNTGEAAV